MDKLLNYNSFIKQSALYEGGSDSKLDDFKKYFASNKSFTLDNTQLYRGISSNAEAIFYAKGANQRKSIDIKNFYTLLTSNLPSWSKFPKRSSAVISSTMYGYAERYAKKGNVYIMIPADGALMATAPAFDVYEVYDKFFKRWNIEDFPEFIEGIEEAYKAMTRKKLDDNDWAKFSKQVEVFDNTDKLIDKVVEEGLILDRFFLEFIEKSKDPSWLGWINTIFNPTKTGFKLHDYKKNFKIKNDGGNDLEVWTEDSCWLVREDLFNELKEQGFFNR